MDVFEAAQERRSIRAYRDTPVPREKLEKILEAGRLAPSAKNIEPWHFIAVTDVEKRKVLSKGIFAKFVLNLQLSLLPAATRKPLPTGMP